MSAFGIPGLSTRVRRRWVVGVVIVSVLVLLHIPLLTLVGRWLVVDDPHSAADFVVLAGGYADSPAGFEEAARLCREHSVRGVLLMTPAESRLEQYGVRPATAEIARAELAARGVPA